jgi:hypothetical protein
MTLPFESGPISLEYSIWTSRSKLQSSLQLLYHLNNSKQRCKAWTKWSRRMREREKDRKRARETGQVCVVVLGCEGHPLQSWDVIRVAYIPGRCTNELLWHPACCALATGRHVAQKPLLQPQPSLILLFLALTHTQLDFFLIATCNHFSNQFWISHNNPPKILLTTLHFWSPHRVLDKKMHSCMHTTTFMYNHHQFNWCNQLSSLATLCFPQETKPSNPQACEVQRKYWAWPWCVMHAQNTHTHAHIQTCTHTCINASHRHKIGNGREPYIDTLHHIHSPGRWSTEK